MARVIRASSHTYAHLPALVTFFGGGCSMTVLSNHKVSRARSIDTSMLCVKATPKPSTALLTSTINQW